MCAKYFLFKKAIQNCKFIFSILVCSSLIFYSNSFAQKAIIDYSTDKDQVILSFKETHGIMSGLNSRTIMDIYGDGTVKVFMPVFMKKAGNYQMKLDKTQLEALLQDLAEKDIPEFDSSVVKNNMKNKIAQKQLSSAQPILFEIHDASVTTIELNLQRYIKLTANNSENGQLFDSSNEILDMSKKITWKGIRSDSKRFPDNETIQQLASTHRSLLELVSNPKLEKK